MEKSENREDERQRIVHHKITNALVVVRSL